MAESHAPAPPPDGTWTDFTETLALVLERRRPIMVGALIGAILFATVGLLTSRKYDSHVSFVPASSSMPLGGLGGVAAQLGLGAATANVGSPDYYADLAESNAILWLLADDSVPVTGGLARVAVADLLDIPRVDPAKRTEKTATALKHLITPRVAPASGIVTITVRTPDAIASQFLCNELFRQLVRLDRQSRNAQAAAQHQYSTQQKNESLARLRAAEDEMQRFLTSNRDFRNSPQLAFQSNRLQRNIDLEQQLYTSLAQSEQNAALDEVRNTPTLTTLDSALVAAYPVSRRLGLRVIAGFLLGIFAVVVLELLRARLGEGGISDSGARLRAAYGETRAEIRRLLRLRRDRTA